jgi:hypothetical protein
MESFNAVHNSSTDVTSMPSALNRGYSNSFLDMLSRYQVSDCVALTVQELNALDSKEN